ncbi:MAG: MFS transporter [Gammaproteobacteria bacterium]|nr:MFS transporter [Gammaproteobacteria bacterium]MCZ6826539.1 MFS transporter [Gammaproteobacteria bacterium]
MNIRVLRHRPVLAWAFYDWANSAYATTVMAGFFPIFFSQYWSAGISGSVTTFRLGVANGTASLIIAFLAPVLGAISDRGGTRMRFLFTFAALGVVMSSSLYFVEQGQWQYAAVIYALATMGFAGSNVFYDSLLVDISAKENFSLISSFGYAMGYIGGGLLFLLNVLMTLNPEWFGLADATQAVRVSFVTVAIWWAVFSIPAMLWVREAPTVDKSSSWQAVTAGLTELTHTLKKIRSLKTIVLFLVAYWLYIDGVNTIIKMAVDFGINLNMAPGDLMKALLLTQFVAFPASLAFGFLGNRIGAKRGIMIGVLVYFVSTLWAGMYLKTVTEFYMLAVTIGLVQGGVQSLSRALYASIIPSDKTAEFFGFYNMLGKFAAVLGPFLVAGVALFTQNSRYAIMAIAPLFLFGAAVLVLVDVDKGHREANALEGAI